jgi:4-amino-4-deoxy-L-arabinose transferase-like glycosyltransferase
LADAILNPHLKSINYALLFFGCLIFHLAGTWSVPLIDRDEPRFAEASREMIERGDYVVPHFNNQLRLDKPPFAYWAQVASYKIFGESDLAARFPSTIAAALIALVIFAWGTRLGSERAGWWAALIFTLSLQTFLHAKAAVADMWLVLFVTLAHWSACELIWGEQTPNFQHPTSNAHSRRWWWVFYLALAFAFLAKGPIGWAPFLTVASTTFFAPGLQLTRHFKFVRGILLVLAIVGSWAIPALIRTRGEFFSIGIGRHVIARSFSVMEGHGANSLGTYLLLLPFYFVTLFVSFFPWSIKLHWLGGQLCRKRSNIDNYLLAGAAIIFIIFSLIKTKLPHYTLPAFPLLSLLLARRWIAIEMPMSFFKRSVVTFAIVCLLIALIAAPLSGRFFPSWELFEQSKNYLRPEMQFGAVDYNEPSLVWYFRSRVHGWLTMPAPQETSVQRFMDQTGPRFVVLPTELASRTYPALPNDWINFRVHGFNIAKGKRVDLTLVLKPD